MNKIAFMFLTVGDLNQPKLIKDFLVDGGDRCTAYAHSKEKGVLSDIQILEKVNTEWGDISLVKATNLMLEEAYKDPDNKYFLLLSESCIPLYSFDIIYDTIISIDKSWIFKTSTHYNKLRLKWSSLCQPNLLGMKSIKDLELCTQWMILTRKHVKLILDHDYTTTVFKNANIPDEGYYINVLKYHDKNFNENNINRRLTFGRMQHKHPTIHHRPNIETIKMWRWSSKESLFGRKVGSKTKILYNQIKNHEKPSSTSRKESSYKTVRSSTNIWSIRNLDPRLTTN